MKVNKSYVGYGVLVVAIVVVGYLGLVNPSAESDEVFAESVSTTQFRNILVDHTTTTDDLTVGDALAVTGAVDLASTLQFGTDDLYAVGHASTGKQVACGTTGVFTATTALDLSGSLSSVDAILVSQITDAASTGAFVSATDPTTTTVTVKSWETDATAGTTGVDVHYCAVGGQ